MRGGSGKAGLEWARRLFFEAIPRYNMMPGRCVLSKNHLRTFDVEWPPARRRLSLQTDAHVTETTYFWVVLVLHCFSTSS